MMAGMEVGMAQRLMWSWVGGRMMVGTEGMKGMCRASAAGLTAPPPPPLCSWRQQWCGADLASPLSPQSFLMGNSLVYIDLDINLDISKDLSIDLSRDM